MTQNSYVLIIFLLILGSGFSNSSNALDLTEFQNKLDKANSLKSIPDASPESFLLESLNQIEETITSKALTAQEIDDVITVVSSLDLIEAELPKEAIISFEKDFLIGANLGTNDLMNASYFLNSLNAASQGMGYSDFSSAVDAYNAQYGTSYTVDSAREALGQ